MSFLGRGISAFLWCVAGPVAWLSRAAEQFGCRGPCEDMASVRRLTVLEHAIPANAEIDASPGADRDFCRQWQSLYINIAEWSVPVLNSIDMDQTPKPSP